MADKIEFPQLKSDAGKELAPYLETILMAQAAILERLDYTPYDDGGPLAKDEILDWLISTVKLKSMKANPPRKGGGTIISFV